MPGMDRGARRTVFVAAFLIFAAVLVPTPAPGQIGGGRGSSSDDVYTLGIVAGDPALSEFSLAVDLATVFSRGQESGPRGERIRLLPVVETGGIQAVSDLLRLGGIDLAMESVPMLEHLRSTGEFNRIEDKLVYLWRMPDIQMHILAGPEVGTVGDLRGKKVNFGPLDGDSALLARELFAASNVNVVEQNLPQGEAIADMHSGDIAATVLVTAKPAAPLLHLAHGSGFHFLPVQRRGDSGGMPTLLTGDDYPNLIDRSQPVATFAFENVLLARPGGESAARRRLLAFFADTVLKRVADLRRPGRHPAWRDFDVAQDVPGWKRYGAVTNALAGQAGPPRTTTGSGTTPAPAASESEDKRLFREFLQWRRRHKEQAR
jgi:uncharacterized protein